MKKFKKIYIEITNRCNLSCSFCHHGSRRKSFMALAAFEEILQKINGYTEYISLHVLGEALVHPHLENILALSREYGLQVNLSTNGLLLVQNQAMLLRQPALRQINISLHSIVERGEESSPDGYLDGIFDFIAAVTTTPLLINLRMWNHPNESDSEPGDASRLIFRRLEEHFKPESPISAELPSGRGLQLAPRVFLSRERRFVWPHSPAPELGAHGYCRGLRDHVAILVDGTVVPCCLDAEGDVPLGNIFQTTMAEILQGSRAVLLREGFARHRLLDPLCRRCTYRLRFTSRSPLQPVPGVLKRAI
ncbi:MAG: SPASM domain-containing protein [Proteobacteria bacterium]|nr:SPASM domain-containing protein [Pseudomonadota bacterium]MBU1737401.1 SPASM domain-containing protein [Pseudomonadota bacterium]